MTDKLRVPEGATFHGHLKFTCKEPHCEAEVEVNFEDMSADEIQIKLDEDIEDRCDECRPGYHHRMHMAQRADDEASEY